MFQKISWALFSVRLRHLCDLVLAPLLDGFWLTMPTKRGRELFKRGFERGPFFDPFFGPYDRGGPPPLESLRHHLRCPATSTRGGNFRGKTEGAQMQRGRAYHLESKKDHGKLKL